ncbi:DUF72 domain-containing protein [Pedobacter aquatilis]|uniref:DUF72 domain-containing protein n=1 Tax=Pedobacter aquatilis TaxID=351343 RepID=UPI00292EC968|nr:DUF72 domain-containing protein [Pedobacter aquatilis]
MSGLILPVPNKAHYPEVFQSYSRLHYYASLNNSIEINTSFYKIPQSRTLIKWVDEVPEDFKFSFKLFKEITHQKQLAFDAQLIQAFMKVINHVGERKGALLVQFPPSIKISQIRQLRHLMATLRENDPDQAWDISVEFRHPSLYEDEVYSILAEYNIAMVIQDKKEARSPLITTNPRFAYLRFHGPNGNYRGSYDSDTLSDYASIIRDWLEEERRVYLYFNNTMGEAIANLKLLRELITVDY